MKLFWRAVMTDGTFRHQDGHHWLHIDQTKVSKLEIIDEYGTIKFSTDKKPIDRRVRGVSDGKGDIHVVLDSSGVTLVSERDGTVKRQGKRNLSSATDLTPDLLKIVNGWKHGKHISTDEEGITALNQGFGGEFNHPFKTDGLSEWLANNPAPKE